MRKATLFCLFAIAAVTSALPQLVNPKAVAQLRWYQTKQVPMFPSPFGPVTMVFDGTSVWFAGQAASGPSWGAEKIRPSDGKILGTFPTQIGPIGMAFDGANVWVSNYDSDSLTKIRASDGTILSN